MVAAILLDLEVERENTGATRLSFWSDGQGIYRYELHMLAAAFYCIVPGHDKMLVRMRAGLVTVVRRDGSVGTDDGERSIISNATWISRSD